MAIPAGHYVVTIASLKLGDGGYDDFVCEGVTLHWDEQYANMRLGGPAQVLEEGEEYSYDPYGQNQQRYDDDAQEGEKVWLDTLQVNEGVAWRCWRIVRTGPTTFTLLRSDGSTGVSIPLDSDVLLFMRGTQEWLGYSTGRFEDLGCYSTDWDNAASTPLRAYAQPGKMVLAN